MDQAKIGRFLQSLRKEKGLTQEQLAERFYVARRTVSRWETGSNMPDLAILVELAEFYDVDLREILDGERKGEEMNTETKNTVLKVAEYSDARQKHMTRVMLGFFVAGIIAIAIDIALDNLVAAGTPGVDFAKGAALGIATGVMILGILYTTGIMERFHAFKMRILKRA